ncbi:MAG: hypothetical protein J6I53_00475 [Treponema sp.]|nr:hypothetical protein [Treponema sp.]
MISCIFFICGIKLLKKMTFKGWVIPAKNALNGVLCVLGLVSIIAYSFFTSENPFGFAEIEKMRRNRFNSNLPPFGFYHGYSDWRR